MGRVRNLLSYMKNAVFTHFSSNTWGVNNDDGDEGMPGRIILKWIPKKYVRRRELGISFQNRGL
jgi:hypothetical protein